MAAVLCALTLGSSVATPLLERDDITHGPTVESEHDPAKCAPRHDHRLCTQVGANHALVASTHDHRAAHVFVEAVAPDAPGVSAAKPLLEGPPTRAPPLV
jgi:hypothetical protein